MYVINWGSYPLFRGVHEDIAMGVFKTGFVRNKPEEENKLETPQVGTGFDPPKQDAQPKGNSAPHAKANERTRAQLEERKDAVLFKFERPGALLEGHLAGIVRAMIQGKPGVDLYFVVNERTDRLVKVHATRKMLEKIRSGDVGRWVSIMFEGVNTSARDMHEFTILVDTHNPPRADFVMEASLLETMAD